MSVSDADYMLVARESFSTYYDGRLEQITAGRTHVRSGHALLKRYPGRFRVASRRTIAMRAAERAAGGEYRCGGRMG